MYDSLEKKLLIQEIWKGLTLNETFPAEKQLEIIRQILSSNNHKIQCNEEAENILSQTYISKIQFDSICKNLLLLNLEVEILIYLIN